MVEVISIYKSQVKLPKIGDLSEIQGFELPQKDQYWQRQELPSFFDKVNYDKDENLLLTDRQEEYAANEVKRCKYGYWFFNNGVPTYITGKNYFYCRA